MNMNIAFVLLFVVFLCGANGSKIARSSIPENGDVVRSYLGVNVYKTERACARLGGLCVHKADCQSLSTKSGLCPENAHRGVECCYEVIEQNKKLTCSEYLGACMKDCNMVALMRPAKDCEEDETCCVLV